MSNPDIPRNSQRTTPESEWPDLNRRPLAPHASALPTALHPDQVGAVSLELTASRSQTARATNCATPRFYSLVSV